MPELIRFSEAAARLGISENTLRRRIREEGVTVYLNPRDKRERLVDLAELEAAMQIKPIDAGGKVKAA